MERSDSSFRVREVQCLCLVLVTVVGNEVEVVSDLQRLIWERLKGISLSERVYDRFDSVKIGLIDKVSADGIGDMASPRLSRRCD